jgi:hypothetical protein
VAVLGLGVLLNFMGLILWLWRTSAPYGRLLFPTLGPAAALVVLGWQQLIGDRYRWAFSGAVVLVMGLYAFIVPWRYLRPAYADPVVTPSAVGAAVPLDAQFGETIELVGYQLAPERAVPGDSVKLTLYWRAIVQSESPLTAFVQVAPRNPEQQVASMDAYVGGSHYPSQMWQPGETIRQVHQLQLADDVPAPGLYWFAVGLYGEPGDERLPVTADGAEIPGRVVRLGPLRVLGSDIPQPGERVDFLLGASVRLVGYDVDLRASGSSHDLRPDSLNLTLYWEATTAPEGEYAVFVHLLDTEGRLVAQHDGPPLQGDFPTWAWQEGDRVPDSHLLSLPSDWKPGVYRLMVGMYRPGDGTRLPVTDEAGQRVQDDVVELIELDLSGEGGRRED